MTIAPLILAASLLFQQAPVDMTVGPSQQTAEAGDVVVLSLDLSSDGASSMVAFDLIMQWDPTDLTLVSATMDPAYSWLAAGFLNDPDGFNDDVLDGEAVFTALVPITEPLHFPPATATVLHITFLVHDSAVVSFPAELGNFTTSTKVVGTAPGTVITGDTPKPVLIEVEPKRTRFLGFPFFGPILPFSGTAPGGALL